MGTYSPVLVQILQEGVAEVEFDRDDVSWEVTLGTKKESKHVKPG